MSSETIVDGQDQLEATRVRRPVLHHVAIKTANLQAIIDWYQKVIGSRVMVEFGQGAFLSNDDANHRIAVFAGPVFTADEGRETRVGMHHFAFEYESVTDLLATFQRLKGEGILPDAALNHGPTTSFYYFDPDGNGVELQADNHGSWEKSSQFIHENAVFAENPAGMPLDPEQMLVDLQAGATPTDLHERGYAGAYLPATPPNLHLPIA